MYANYPGNFFRKSLTVFCRLGQILNLFWEKTPENVFYTAVEKTVGDLELTLTDYTAVEDIHLKDIQGESV